MKYSPKHREEMEADLCEELEADVSCVDAGHDSFVFRYSKDGKESVVKLYDWLQHEKGLEEARRLIERYIEITKRAAERVATLEEGYYLAGEEDKRVRMKAIVLPQGEIGYTRTGIIYTRGQKYIDWPNLWQADLEFVGKSGYEALLHRCHPSFHHYLHLTVKRAIADMFPSRYEPHPVNIKVKADLEEAKLHMVFTDLVTNIKEGL